MGTNSAGVHFIGGVSRYTSRRNLVRSNAINQATCEKLSWTHWTAAAGPVDLDGTPYHTVCKDVDAAGCQALLAAGACPGGSCPGESFADAPTDWEDLKVGGSAMAGDEEEADSPAAGLAAASRPSVGNGQPRRFRRLSFPA